MISNEFIRNVQATPLAREAQKSSAWRPFNDLARQCDAIETYNARKARLKLTASGASLRSNKDTNRPSPLKCDESHSFIFKV